MGYGGMEAYFVSRGSGTIRARANEAIYPDSDTAVFLLQGESVCVCVLLSQAPWTHSCL